MSRGPVGWAIIGCGRVSDRRVAPAITRAADATLAAVCSRRMDVARDFAARHGAARSHDSIESLLADSAVQAVYIGTPNSLHADHAARCLAAGRHVLVEKPMAIDTRQAADMVRAAEAARRHLGVMLQQRFHPANIHLFRLNDEGALGRLTVLRAKIGIWYPPVEHWRFARDLAGGGVLMDLGSHAIDLMIELAGPVESVDAYVGSVHSPGPLEDFCLARLHFRGGAIGVLELGYCMHDYGGRLEVHGAEATYIAHGSLQQAATCQTWLRRATADEPMRSESVGDCFRAAIDDFTDAILHGGEPTVSMHDGLRAVRVIEAAYESSARRVQVQLPD